MKPLDENPIWGRRRSVIVRGLPYQKLIRKETIMSKLVLSTRFGRPIFIGLLMLSAIPARSVSPPAPYKISGIKAMLFYDGKGTFSRDVLAKPDFSFWNTIIGEGDAEGPSNSTLVLIEISGNPSRDEASPSRKVEFTAIASGKVILKRASDIGLFTDGKFYAGFWLYDTGCQPIKLSARIMGQAQQSAMNKTIPFKCGE